MSIVLPYLSEEEITDLTLAGYPGAKIYWRPMDLEDKAKWADECRKQKISTASTQSLVLMLKQQFTKVEDFPKVLDREGNPQDFDADKHFRYLPLTLMAFVAKDISDRSNLGEGMEKNFERPSEPSDTPGTAI